MGSCKKKLNNVAHVNRRLTFRPVYLLFWRLTRDFISQDPDRIDNLSSGFFIFCRKNYISAFFFIYTVTAVQRMRGASDHVFLSQTCTGTPLALGAVGARERFPNQK